MQRIEEPDKNWKFEDGDLKERTYWQQYKKAYKDMLSHTSTHNAHWYIVPADEKWFSRVAIGRILVNAMEEMDLFFPVVSNDKKNISKGRQRIEK